MKKALFLALCVTSFLMGAQKECVSFADTDGDGCLVRERYSNGEVKQVFEIKGEKVRVVCTDSGDSGKEKIPKCKKNN